MTNMNEDRSSDQLVLGGLLFLVFSLVVALVFVYTRAGVTESGESPTTTAEIANESPAVDSVNVAYADNGSHIATSTGLALTPGTTKTVVVWGVVSDPNGFNDIDNVALKFYRSGATGGSACADDENDCYSVASCTLSGGSGTTEHYACTIALAYNTDSSTTGGAYPTENFAALVTVADLSAVTTSSSADAEVNTLLALDIPTAIAYGTFALGATTTSVNNQTMTLTQKGNDVADVAVSGTDMTCTLGTIPVANQKWALTDVGYTDATNALSVSATDTNAAIGYQTTASASTKDVHWNIGIPSTGVRGSCSGTNTISILAAE